VPEEPINELANALESLARVVIRLPSSSPMTLTAAATLTSLEREGPTRLSELASREGTTQPTMTQLVTRLEKEGLVTRNPDPDDGRAVLVAITPGGSEALAERRAERANGLRDLVSQLPRHEQKSLAAAAAPIAHLVQLARASDD
jgi:DNA-binding MarR family transcriptional regulator